MSAIAKLKLIDTAKNRKHAGLLWFAANIGYDIVRSFVISAVFSKHGVNGWVYLSIALVASAAFSFVSFRLVTSLIDKKHQYIGWYALLTSATFFAPDIYVLLCSRQIPAKVYAILFTYLACTTILAAKSLHTNYKKQHDKT